MKTRYSFIVANRKTGSSRRFTVQAWPIVVILLLVLALPITWFLSARRVTQFEIENLRLKNARLEIENSSYRGKALDISAQIKSLRSAIEELSARSIIDTQNDRLIEKIHTFKAIGLPAETEYEDKLTEQSFGLLGDLLGSLEDRLDTIRRGVAYREALVQATPVIWPTEGWLSGTYGYRTDPFTGQRDFHPAIDISTSVGEPVYATATGQVVSAAKNGAYGNLIEINHGFGLSTRYGHLSSFAVSAGDTVLRGDVIGYVGATGRATGSHVHYEILSGSGKINPMRLLATPYP